MRMLVAKVVGKVWATKKHHKLNGQRFSLATVMDAGGDITGRMVVAVDNIGAGVGDLVLICTGNVARSTLDDVAAPIDAAIIAIIDTIEMSE